MGAGKTIVALLASIVALENGLQVAFMAPTEILAAQHYANIARLLASSRFRADLLTGSTPGLRKHTLLAHIERVGPIQGTLADLEQEALDEESRNDASATQTDDAFKYDQQHQE